MGSGLELSELSVYYFAYGCIVKSDMSSNFSHGIAILKTGPINSVISFFFAFELLCRKKFFKRSSMGISLLAGNFSHT